MTKRGNRNPSSLRSVLGMMVVVLAGLGAGCGSGGSGADQDLEADGALAEQALLTASDLGEGWSSQPRVDDEDPEFDAIFETVIRDETACAAIVEEADRQEASISELELATDAPVRRESPEFVFGPSRDSDVEHTVSVYATADDAADPFRLVRELGWADCVVAVYDDLFQALFEARGVAVAMTAYTATQEQPELGDEAIELHIEMTFEAPDGTTLDFEQGFSAARSGRVVSGVTQTSADHGIGDMAAITKTAFEKVEAAFSSN